MIDDNHFIHRLKRYASSSSSLISFGSRMIASGKLNNLTSLSTSNQFYSKYGQELLGILGNLRGPLMKIGQFLSIVPDLIPAEFAHHLEDLQYNAPPMGELFVKRRMSMEMGPDWMQNFSSFDPKPCAAASLGQVHKAQDLNGNTLACKLQYPNMQAAVDADLNQLKILLHLYKSKGGAIDPTAMYEEIATKLREELDYVLERQSVEKFRTIFESIPEIHCPKTYNHLSTSKLLTMEYLSGKSLQEMSENRVLENRNQMAKNLFKAWYIPFYRHGLLQGDPHYGNYNFQENFHINLFDFGCVRQFSTEFIQGVILLYEGLLHNDTQKINEAYKIWGFTQLNNEIIEILNLWARFLYEPLLDDKIRPIRFELNGIRGKEIAILILKKLKEKGGVRPPPEFVFMDRVAVGLGSAFIKLKAEVNWHQLFNEIVYN